MLARYRQIFFRDPLSHAQAARSKPSLFVIGMNDDTVPTNNQLALWYAFGEPERIDFPSNHLATIVGSYTLKKLRFLRFFRENLSVQ